MNRLFQTPILDKDGNFHPEWQRWFRDQDLKVRPVLTILGKIAASAPIDGRTEGVGTTVQNLTNTGEFNSLDKVIDGGTYGKALQTALNAGQVDLSKVGVVGPLGSSKVIQNVTSNFTNNCTVDSSDNGVNADVRAYGPGGPGTTWHQQQGSVVGPEIPALATTAAYTTSYSIMYDPDTASYSLFTDGFSTLPDKLLFAGALTTVAAGGGGGTTGGGGSGGGSGGGGGRKLLA